jgi:hypothetical protein
LIAKSPGSWLNAFPSTPALTLLDSHFSLAVRLRIGLPPQDDLPAKCRCGERLSNDLNHFLSCKLLRRTIVNTRHDICLRVLVSFVRQAGGAVFLEPKFLNGKRADAKVFFPIGTPPSLDLSITHPACKSYVTAAQIPLGAALRRATLKHNKYDEQARQDGSYIVPFVLETFGGLGPEAHKFLNLVASMHAQLVTDPSSNFKSLMIRSLAVTLQRANALVQLVGCVNAREHSVHRIVPSVL